MQDKYNNRLPFSKLFERKLSNKLSTILLTILFVSHTMLHNNYLLKKGFSKYVSSAWVYKDRFPTLRHLFSGERWSGQVYSKQTKSSTWKHYGKSS